VVETSSPSEHGLPGHGWTLKKLKQWVFQTFGRHAGRNSIRRVPRRAKLTWTKVKKRRGKAKPEKRAAHVDELLKLFAAVCDGEVILVYVDEVHVHRDLDLG
jgi:transposase